LLNQLTADVTGRRVVTGPIEATAIGNIILQAMALGHVASLKEARQVVRNSFEVDVYEPSRRTGWESAYDRLLSLMEQIG
jgi:sugar (pentulose or hexulose) kinase